MSTPPEWGELNSKTVSWYDPRPIAVQALTMSGLDFLSAMQRGELPFPPIGALIGMTAVSVGEGDVVFACTPDDSVYNPIGVVHGGLVCTLLDTVAGCAVHSTLPAGVGYTSMEIKVSYLRPVTAGIRLLAHGWTVKPGRRAAFAEADVRDADGRLYATASSTCLILG